MICKNISVNDAGHLAFAGRDTVELAEKYGTPLYLTDGDRIRENCRVYLEAMREAFGEGAMPLYASKAASYKEIYRIMKTLGMGIDVVSSGEVYTAVFRAEGDTMTRLMPDSAMPAKQLEAWLQEQAEPFLAVGDGVPVLQASFKLPVVTPPVAIAEQCVVGVALAALAAFREGARGTDATLAPIYLRLPQAERERLAKQAQ